MTRTPAGNARLSDRGRAAAEELAAAFETREFSREDIWERADVGVSWVPVQSTVFGSAAYSSCENLLYLRFRSGDVYCYFDFSVGQYQEFLAAGSKGEYFARHIRNRFRYSQIHAFVPSMRLTEDRDCRSAETDNQS